MSIEFESLLRRSTLHVDLIRAEPRGERVACTFTPFHNRDCEGLGYAGSFLLKRGFDVIAFKSSVDDWYQSVLFEDLEHVRRIIVERGYREAVGYGSSMGAFAAIAFSGALGLDRVLAYSPQYRIDQDFDTRWLTCFKAIPVWRHEIGGSTRAAVTIAYDSSSQDARHVEMIRNALPAGQVTELRLPFSGHPCVYFLLETDQLGQLAETILLGGRVPRVDRTRRHQSVHYCKTFALAALQRQHFRWAALALEQALRLAPEDEETLMLQRRLKAKAMRWRLRHPFRAFQGWLRRPPV